MSLLDMIGPVMVGPSSSHTAGACRLGLLARHTLIRAPSEARLELHGSFAKTGKGHGTELALAAGILGFRPDDARLPEAVALAEQEGVSLSFTKADLGDVHPNTVRITLANDEERVSLTGSSLGGGAVKVFAVQDFDSSFSGSLHTLLVQHTDTPGIIARVARVIADDEVNIATLHSARRRRGGQAMMSIELDRRLAQYALDYLTRLPYVSWLRMLPEVMSGSPSSPAPVEAGTKSGTVGGGA